MQLPERNRQQLISELRYVVQQMREHEADIFVQLYFFSAGYGIASRLLNEKWDAELSLIHLVLQNTYNVAQMRLQNIASGSERAVGLPDTFMNALIEATERLESAIRDKKDSEVFPILARFGELAYVMTGNGYYLFLKGELRI